MAGDKQPNLTDKARQQAAERDKRRAEALRANLHRRKAQTRARQDEAAQDAAPILASDEAAAEG